VCGLGLRERRQLAVLDQDVVERERQLAVRRRPVVAVTRDDEDVPVQAQLLAVVLADVRVVPVGAWIGHADLVREGLADRDRRLRLVGAVVAVLEPEAVPVHGRIEVAAVRDMHRDRRVLGHFQGRAGDGAVVGEHANGGVPDLLPYRDDLQIELVTVGELDDLGAARVRKPLGRARKLNDVGAPVCAVVVHGYLPFSGRCSCPDAGLFVRGRGSRRRLLQGPDPLSEELGVVLHPADQRRSARPLPGETEEAEARDVRHPALVS
jgi:hypothetical protein